MNSSEAVNHCLPEGVCLTWQNTSKGHFSKKKVWAKRALELGSGMGLGGMTFALLGCREVILTDLDSVLPLLRKNVEANMSKTALMGEDFKMPL